MALGTLETRTVSQCKPGTLGARPPIASLTAQAPAVEEEVGTEEERRRCRDYAPKCPDITPFTDGGVGGDGLGPD